MRSPILSAYARVCRLRGLGYATAVAVGVALVLGSAGRMYPLAQGALAGQDPTDAVSILNRAAALGAVADLAFALALVPAGVLVIAWLFLARRNIDSFVGAQAPLSPAWAIVGWFVPLINLVYPCRLVAGVARASLFRPRTRLLVGVWWAGWLGAGVVDVFVRRWAETARQGLPTEVAGPTDLARHVAFHTDALLRMAPVALLMLASGIALILLVLRISQAHDRRIRVGRAIAAADTELTYAGQRGRLSAAR